MNIAKSINHTYDADSDMMIINQHARLKMGEGRCENCGAQLHSGKKKRYCSNPECQAVRLAEYYAAKKLVVKEKVNTIIETNPALEGRTIVAQCAAHGPKGRCKNKLVYKYELTRTVYPRFCDCHGNAFRRELLAKGKIRYENSEWLRK